MKKSTKISLLVSLILVIAGVVCIFISLLGVGFDMRKFSNMTFEKKVFDITDSFEVVHIIEENDDIELYLSEDNTMNVHISNLRKKIAKLTDEPYIETVYGMGYRLSR